MNNSILPTQTQTVKPPAPPASPAPADPEAWIARMGQHLFDREPGTSADYGFDTLLADLDYDDLADVATALETLIGEGNGWDVDAATLARCREIEAEAPRWWLGEVAA
jgi:hypothetical protein